MRLPESALTWVRVLALTIIFVVVCVVILVVLMVYKVDDGTVVYEIFWYAFPRT